MSFDACAAMVARADPERFAATMTAPVAKRGGLFALYAFNLEVARAPWVTAEPMIAEMRLQWWFDAIGEIFEGKPVRRHEVVEPLAMTIGEGGLPRAPFDALISARQFEIANEPHTDWEGLKAYIRGTSTGLLQLACLHLEADLPEDALEKIGLAFGLANLIRALPELDAAGKRVLPSGLPASEPMGAKDVVVQMSNLQNAAGEALAGLQTARGMRLPKVALPALRISLWAETILKQTAADPKVMMTGLEMPSEFQARRKRLWQSITGRW